MPKDEGFYRSPTKKVIDHPAKIVVVLGTYIPDGKTSGARGRRHQPFKNNLEYLDFTENKLHITQFTLACHKHFNAGMDYDLIIVDNSSTDLESVEYLKNYSTENNIVFLSRENTGFSYGSFKYAWDMFKDKYQYYMFHEQDFTPCQDNWLSTIVCKFLSEREIGAVGNKVEARANKSSMDIYRPEFQSEFLGDYFDVEDFLHFNLDGHWMFTSTQVLQECGLNVVYEGTGRVNELIWQHHILNAGYKLVGFSDGTYITTSGLNYVDHSLSDGPLAPLIHCQVLYCNEEFRKYFDWYQGLKNFEFVNR